MARRDTHIYAGLRDKWIKKHKDLQESLWARHGDVIHEFVNNTKNFAIGSISGIMLLTSPISTNLLPPTNALTVQSTPQIDSGVFLISDLGGLVPDEVRELTHEEEEKISDLLTKRYGFSVKPELEGKRLNRSYGYIGAEQHLARYPGDTMQSHFDNPDDASKYYSSGMAPGLGAWGYFARSQNEMTQEDSLKEKYYIATQTFLAPGFKENVRDYITFFKHRKMLLVNPDNGKAMVVVIGDAGPAAWTGKHLGGSPEVMKYLERVDGRQKGPVLYFFVDDPENKVPLGPVDVK